MTIVLVSALYDLRSIESSSRRSIDEYLGLGRLLLESRHHLVIFTEPELADEVRARRAGGPLEVVPLPFEKLPHAGRVAEIEACLGAGRRGNASTNPVKDSARYMALMWSKPALLATATSEPLLDAATMCWWVDFGLAHAAGAHPELEFDELIEKVVAPLHFVVRWQPSRAAVADRPLYYRETRGATVGGSLFGARPDRASWLADRMAEEVARCIEAGWPTTEEVLLGAIFAEHSDECHTHYASPRSTLVNLLGPRADAYVVLDAIRTLNEDDQPCRALALAREIEQAHLGEQLVLGRGLEVLLYDLMLVAAWYAGEREESARAAAVLRTLADRIPAGTRAGETLRSDRVQANIALAGAKRRGAVDPVGAR